MTDASAQPTEPSASPPTPPAERQAAVEGQLAGREPPAALKVLFGLTGISLLIYLVQLFTRFVLGRRRTGKLSVDGGRIVLEEHRRLLGRETEAGREAFARASVLSVRIDTRYPYLLTLVGLLFLGAGVISGILFLLDGLQGEFTPWILTGVGLLVGGVALDLALTTVASSLPGQTTLVLHLPNKRVVRLIGCDPAAAARIVTWLHQDGG